MPDELPSVDTRPHRRLYHEARQDVRTYAQLQIQVVTLLLTTMFVLLGWLASSYAADTFRIAMRVRAPQLLETPPAASLLGSQASRSQAKMTSAKQAHVVVGPPQEEVLTELHDASVLYRTLLIRSPVTSLLLGGGCFFAAVIAGTLIIVSYQIQRRRIQAHTLVSHSNGLDSITDLGTRAVIERPLTAIIVTVLIASVLILLLLFYQIGQCLPHERHRIVQFCLVVIAMALTYKLVHVIVMAYTYYNSMRNAALVLRSVRGLRLLEELQNMAHSCCQGNESISSHIAWLRIHFINRSSKDMGEAHTRFQVLHRELKDGGVFVNWRIYLLVCHLDDVVADR